MTGVAPELPPDASEFPEASPEESPEASPGWLGHRLVILGAGVMGTGIAALALGHGVRTVLVDVDPVALGQAEGRVSAQLRHAQLMEALPEGRPVGELVTGGSVRDAVEAADATVVIEAVTESPEAKSAALTEAAAAVRIHRWCPTPPVSRSTSWRPVCLGRRIWSARIS